MLEHVWQSFKNTAEKHQPTRDTYKSVLSKPCNDVIPIIDCTKILYILSVTYFEVLSCKLNHWKLELSVIERKLSLKDNFYHHGKNNFFNDIKTTEFVNLKK